jgi:sulfide:quinone oxidoreductase
MKDLVILGAGTAGTMMLNKLHHALDRSEWRLTIIDKDRTHYYQPGFLFIPFGMSDPDDVTRPKADFFPEDTNAVWAEVEELIPEEHAVRLADGREIAYDLLIVATGVSPDPDETPGLHGELWYEDIFDFYTHEGATRLADTLDTWAGGRLVINMSEPTIKCPIAPLEFAFLADAYFTEKGMRDEVEIVFTTPHDGAFTKPIASKALGTLMEKKGIEVVPDFYVMEVDEDEKTLRTYDGKEEPFDLLVSIPTNKGADYIGASDMGDAEDLNFIPTDNHTLQAEDYEDVFVIGDTTNVPTSKAGSVAHFEAEVLEENVLSYIKGEPLTASFDGHANCFIETGFGKATLIDFNYDTQPLPGKFPIPVLGPMSLLKETRLNHFGKLAFEWVYWHMLLPGRHIPVPTHMSMAGKVPEEKAAPDLAA